MAEKGSDSTIITSLCWVSRGYAQQVVDEYEPNPDDVKVYKQMAKKLEK